MEEYVAPYYPQTQWPKEGEYIVSFNTGHTLDAHLKIVPDLSEAEPRAYRDDKGYYAKLSPALLELVRRDPGVKYVEQNGGGSWD